MTTRPLTGKQAASYRLATARMNVWEGSVRSSKTIVSILKWCDFVLHGPPGNLLMVGKTERTLRRNVIDPLTEMLGPQRARYVAGAGELYLLGRKVYVAGANDERAQEKIRGLSLVGAYADEASTLPESFWSMLGTRLSTEGARLFATTNPDSPAHWLKKGFLDRARTHLTGSGELREHDGADRLDLARFSFRLYDNPHLPADYLRALDNEYVGLWHRRYVLGEWVIAEGAVYEMWDPARHIVSTLPPLQEVLGVGVDYGTRNPFAAVMLALTSDRRLVVTRELRHDPSSTRRQKTDAEFSADLAAWIGSDRPRTIAVDPSAASFKLQLHRDRVASVRDANNEVLDGVRTVASLLGNNRLLVHESCAGLLNEIPGYSWDDDAAERGEDKPIKAEDHSCDALRYAVLSTRQFWSKHIQGAHVAAT